MFQTNPFNIYLLHLTVITFFNQMLYYPINFYINIIKSYTISKLISSKLII